MKIEGKNCFYIYTVLNDKILELEYVDKWTNWLFLNKKCTYSTVLSYVNSLSLFWDWTLYNEVLKDEDIEEYIVRYREDLINGFEINTISNNEFSNTKVSICIARSSSKEELTIKKESTAIESFFNYLYDKGFSDKTLLTNVINKKFIKNIRKDLDISGYKIKMGPISEEVWSKRSSKIYTKKIHVNDDYRAFPYELFLELLSISKPREKLIYLLCGGASARIGQALNFTFYDINYEQKEIWLCDPRSNYKSGPMMINRKKWLSEKYNINCHTDKPHKSIAFKYPIPSFPRRNLPLMWSDPILKNLFFENLLKYNPIKEHLIEKKHPFAFVTKEGNRIPIRNVQERFKRHCKILQDKYKDYDLGTLSMHSLRHMYGVYMSELYALAIEGKIDLTPELIKIYCQRAMGHKNEVSNNIYFNMRFEREMKLGQYLYKRYKDNKDVYLSFANLKVNYENKI